MSAQLPAKPVLNPLLAGDELPPFSAIRAEHIVPAVDYLIARNRALVEDVCANPASPTWANTVAPLAQADDELNSAFSPVSHLANVQDSPALRDAYREALTMLSSYGTDMGQHAGLYARYEAIKASAEFAQLNEEQQAAVEHALRDFRLSGIALPPEQQAEFKQLMQDLSTLQNKFSENVLDATQGWTKHITDESRLAGEGILLQPSSRGGDVTYHGPGQWVLYPILKLGKNEMGAHGYLHALESVAIETAKAFVIDAFRREGKAGAWCDAGKFSAIGFRFTRWVSSHGLSFNVCPNLAHFDLIVGCGLVGEPVTSFLEIMGADSPDMYAVALEISRQAQIVFQRDWSTVEPDALIG